MICNRPSRQCDYNRPPTFFCVRCVYSLYCSCFYFFDNPNLQLLNIQLIVFAQAAYILLDVCIQTCDLILSNRIGRELRYGEFKKLASRGV